jgi:predicted PurR-regulated permease PerM
MTDTPPGARLASPDDAQNARRRVEHDPVVDARLPAENAPAQAAGPARERRTGRAGVPAGVPATAPAARDADPEDDPDATAGGADDDAYDADGPRGAHAAGRRLGAPGRPMNRQSPFYLGFVGAIGVLVAYGLVTLVTRLSSVITLLTVSLFLALGLDPVVEWLRARGLERRWAVLVVFLGVIALFIGVVSLLVPPVVQEATQLAGQAPDLAQQLLRNPRLRALDDQYGLISRAQRELQTRLTSGQLWTTVFGGVLGAGKAVASGFFSAFTVLILTLYFLASLPLVKSSAYRLVPRTRRQRVTLLSEEISRRVGGYFMGQITVATINGACSYVMMKIVGIPYAAVLAVAVGVLGLIPMVGAILGAVLVVVVALFNSTTSAIVVAVYYVIYQQLENYFISPKVMQRTVSVPGAITVVAALAGGTLLGVLGALMAIPVAAGLLLVYQQVLVPRQEQH